MEFFAAAALFVLACLAANLGRPALALVVSGSGDSDGVSELRPLDDPGWDYVVGRANASAVYLGDRWVLTANHVQAGSVNISGRVFRRSDEAPIQIANPPGIGLSSHTDLQLYRLEEDPGLPPITISAEAPRTGSEIMMVGFGRTRGGELSYWSVDSLGEWIDQESEVGSDYAGFRLGPQEKRWGTNTIDASSIVESGQGDVIALNARFDLNRTEFEARGAGGDSGGGVFYKNNDAWELLGIIQSISTVTDQPAGIAAFSNTTNIADLTRYRDQILSIVGQPDPVDVAPWQNPHDRLNVNDDLIVSAADVLAVINEINDPTFSDPETGQLPIPPIAGGPPMFFDVSGDNLVSAVDALLVINQLNSFDLSPTAALTIDPFAGISVPEPSSIVLLAAACLFATGSLRRAYRV